MSIENTMSKLRELNQQKAELFQELEQIAELKRMGIVRHHIIKRRDLCKCGGTHVECAFARSMRGQSTEGMSQIILQDGSEHTIPSRLLSKGSFKK